MSVSKYIIGVVGPCSAGKSTLIDNLAQYGYVAKHIAQEHSYVKDMWKHIGKSNLIIYLDVSYDKSMLRRPLNMSASEFEEQKNRLSHACKNADYYVNTTEITPQGVLTQVLSYLEQSGFPAIK